MLLLKYSYFSVGWLQQQQPTVAESREVWPASLPLSQLLVVFHAQASSRHEKSGTNGKYPCVISCWANCIVVYSRLCAISYGQFVVLLIPRLDPSFNKLLVNDVS